MKQITRTTLAFMLCAAVAFMGGCSKDKGKSSSAGGGGSKAAVKNSTVKETLQSFYDVTKEQSFKNFPDIVVPQCQEAFRIMLGSMDEVSKAAKDLQTAAKAKFGQEQADDVRQAIRDERDTNSPLDEAADTKGKIDWTQVKIIETGDTATYEINGKPQKEQLRRVDGLWYVDLLSGKNVTPDKLLEKAKETKAGNDKIVAAIKALTKKVKSGAVKKQDFPKSLKKIEDMSRLG